MRAVGFVLVVLLLVGALAYTGIRSYLRTRSAKDATLEQLVGKLKYVDRERIAHIATGNAPCPSLLQEGMEPEDLWEWIGGLAGLRNLAWNCEVLIELACYVQRWYPEAVAVAEQLRLNAREIQWHLTRLQGAEEAGHLRAVFPDYAERTVAVYYAMTRDLLYLFEQAAPASVPLLQNVI